MYSNISKRIFSALEELHMLPKTVIKYGIRIFFVLFISSSILFIYNHSIGSYNAYIELISTSLIKSSFTLLAEFIIGSLVIDYIFKKN